MRPENIHIYFEYILTNSKNTFLYTEVTNDLERRCFEHKQKNTKGFTNKYNVNKQIYFEQFDCICEAIAREKQIKGYSRLKKITLVNNFNKGWTDLYCDGKIALQ
jgi:putative endonuclease